MTGVVIVEEAEDIHSRFAKGPHQWDPACQSIASIHHLAIPLLGELIHLLMITQKPEITRASPGAIEQSRPVFRFRHPCLIYPGQRHPMPPE